MQHHPILLALSLFVLAFSTAFAFREQRLAKDHYRNRYDEGVNVCRRHLYQSVMYSGLEKINDVQEEMLRIDAFCKTCGLVKKNSQLNETSFRMIVNDFSIILPHEVPKVTGYLGSAASAAKHAAAKQFKQLDNYDIPKGVDWREVGIVTPVLQQVTNYNDHRGSCGSSWAFSAAGALASHYLLQKKKNETLVEFSEQELVDCSTKYGNSGCGGGLMSNAFDYVKEAGIETTRDYAYEGKDAKCRQTNEKVVTRVSGYVAIPTGNEDALREAVARVGPVSVAITVTRSFFSYKDGVFHDESCDGQELNHGALLVGFGTDPVHGNYWLVKNSWGAKWGEKGYIRISRSNGKGCGIAKEASFPVFV